MLDKLQAFLSRVRVRWHALTAALLTAAPVLLDQLGVIDFKPILSHYMAEENAAVLLGLLPFLLAFLKPMVHIEPEPTEAAK